MDNKQDRQFYWEVKQFLNNGGPKESVSKATPSIKDAISSVVNENKVFKQNNFSKETSSQKVVPSYLDGLIKAEKGFQPSCKAYTSNNTVNPFNITEQKNDDDAPPQPDQDETMSPRDSVYDNRGRGGSMVAGRMPGYASGQAEGSSNLMSPAELRRLEKLTKINADAQDRMARQQATRDALRAQRAQDRLAYLENELADEDMAQFRPEYSEEDRKNLTYEQMMTKIGSAGRKALQQKRAERNFWDAANKMVKMELDLANKYHFGVRTPKEGAKDEYEYKITDYNQMDLSKLDDKEIAELAFLRSARQSSLKSAFPSDVNKDGTQPLERDKAHDELRKRMQAQQGEEAKAKAKADLDKPISAAYRTTRRAFKDTFGQDFNSSTENMQRLQALEAGNKDAVGGWQAVRAHRETLGAMVDDAKAAERTANVDAIKSEGEYLRFKQDPNYRKQQIAADTQKIKETEAFKRQMAQFRREMGITEAVSNILNKKKINEGIEDSIYSGINAFGRGVSNLVSSVVYSKPVLDAKAAVDSGLESLGLRKTKEQEEEEQNKRNQETDARAEAEWNKIREAGRQIGKGVSQTLASADQTLRDTAPKPVQGVDASNEATDKALALSSVIKSGDVMKTVGNIIGGEMGSTVSAAGSGIVRGGLDLKYGANDPKAPPALLAKDSNDTTTPSQGSNTPATPSLLEKDPNVPTPPAKGSPAPNPAPTASPSPASKTPAPTTPASRAPAPAPTSTTPASGAPAPAPTSTTPASGAPAPARRGALDGSDGILARGTIAAQQKDSKSKPQYKPGMSNATVEKQKQASNEKQRQFNNRQPGRNSGNSMLQQGMQMASRYGVNPMSQLGAGSVTLPSALNIPFRTLGQSSQQNLSGFAMSRGFI